MKNPTTIKTKTVGRTKTSTFFTLAYNGKELGKLAIHNIFTNAGTQGVRIVWQEEGKGWDSTTQGIVYEYTDKDLLGNIKHTK